MELNQTTHLFRSFCWLASTLRATTRENLQQRLSAFPEEWIAVQIANWAPPVVADVQVHVWVTWLQHWHTGTKTHRVQCDVFQIAGESFFQIQIFPPFLFKMKGFTFNIQNMICLNVSKISLPSWRDFRTIGVPVRGRWQELSSVCFPRKTAPDRTATRFLYIYICIFIGNVITFKFQE